MTMASRELHDEAALSTALDRVLISYERLGPSVVAGVLRKKLKSVELEQAMRDAQEHVWDDANDVEDDAEVATP